MFFSTYENDKFIRNSGIVVLTHVVLSEPVDKAGCCSDISEINEVIVSMYFQRTDTILEINFSFRN